MAPSDFAVGGGLFIWHEREPTERLYGSSPIFGLPYETLEWRDRDTGRGEVIILSETANVGQGTK